MTIRDLIPWSRNRAVGAPRGEEANPVLAFRREMDRLFDETFRGFGLGPLGMERMLGADLGWPRIEVADGDKEVKVTAELPGLDENDVTVELANGVLSISGEKTFASDDKERLFSEHFYGRFERRIPVDEVEQARVSASFKNGLLTVTLPKSPEAQQRVKRIAINGKQA
jgi:HSP20 family protein